MLSWFKPKEAPPPFKTMGQRLLYGLGALVALAVLSPIALLALSTIASIASAVVVAVGLVALAMALPAAHRWWKITVLKMKKASARLNPVETLELDYIRRKEAHQLARGMVTKIEGHCAALRERLEGLKLRHGRTDDGLERLYTGLSGLSQRLRTSVNNAGTNLERLKAEVDYQRDRWEAAKATGDLAKMLKTVGEGGDVTDQFLADTAIDAIRNNLAHSFAEINDILGAEDAKQVPDLKLIEVPAMPVLAAPARELEPALARR